MTDMMKRPKITPAHGPSWYLKWVATIVLLIGASFNSLEIVPINFYFMLTGTALWFFANSENFSVFYKDRNTGDYCTSPKYWGKIVNPLPMDDYLNDERK